MVPVIIYTTAYCPYCTHAKALLARKGVAFTEIDVTGDEAQRLELVARTGGRRTVPQIFFGERSIGGYDELAALERNGQLDPLLTGS